VVMMKGLDQPRCEKHINTDLVSTSTDYRCQVAGCDHIVFMCDPELHVWVCGDHNTLSPSKYRNINARFQLDNDYADSDSDYDDDSDNLILFCSELMLQQLSHL
jgi:hypothetical protein